jgi:hypothetical protein
MTRVKKNALRFFTTKFSFWAIGYVIPLDDADDEMTIGRLPSRLGFGILPNFPGKETDYA